MKALRNVTSVTAMELPQLSTLSLRAALLSVNEVNVRNAGMLEKSRELEEGMKKMKQNEDKESSEKVKRNTKCLRFFLSWLNVVFCLVSIAYNGVYQFGCRFPAWWNMYYYYSLTPISAVFFSVSWCIVLLLYELHVKKLDKVFRRYLGFLYTYVGRTVFILLYSLGDLYYVIVYRRYKLGYDFFSLLMLYVLFISLPFELITVLLNTLLPLLHPSFRKKEFTLLSDPSPDYSWTRPVTPLLFLHRLENDNAHHLTVIHYCIIACFSQQTHSQH